MLVSFKISNFLSFNKEQTFSMVPSLDGESTKHINLIKNVKLLKMGIILGANSSGKSNLLKAIAVGTNLITGDAPLKYKNFFCKINKENQNNETLFEYSFYVNNQFYTYGFTINLYSGKFLTEYLYGHDLEVDQEKVIFERVSEDNNLEDLITYRLEANNNLKKRLNKFIKEFENSSRNLFVTKLNMDKEFLKQLKEFNDVYSYFNEKVNIYFQNQDFKVLDVSFMDKKDEVNNLLNFFDTGISEVVFEEIEQNILHENYKNNELKDYIESRKVENKFSFTVRINQAMICICYKDSTLKVYKLLLKHIGADLAFEFFEESDGIRRLFDLFDLLLAPRENSIYIFDELSRSIHPLLIIKFLETFNINFINFPVQLVFTTHESNILKDNILRKDEIWFVEKDKDNASKIYSLDIFKITNKKLIDSYLDGNYGAVPIFFKGLE